MARKTKGEASHTRQQIITAARSIFYKYGVAHSTLEDIAHCAGLTRGAIYWHFKDKADLFFSMREEAFTSLIERTNSILLLENHKDPLDAIEAALNEFFSIVAECNTTRQILEIIILRCECVNEFAAVQAEANELLNDFLEKIKNTYDQAAAKGTLRLGLTSKASMSDTRAFSNGLFYQMLTSQIGSNSKIQVSNMISTHIALRRQR